MHPADPLQPLLPVKPPLRVLILFAMGQFGWSLASYAVGNLLVYFYLPPEQGSPVFPSFLFQGAVLGVFTLIGILSAGGRVLDGIIDPMVANWSDRSQSKWGKRRKFMLMAALPFAVFGALVFFPVSSSENASNFIWLALVISIYYFFFAMYVIPYNALMAELGHNEAERLKISTIVSVAWALGFVAGNSAYALQGVFEQRGNTPVLAFQTAVLLLQALALIFMLMPALFLNESRYAQQANSDHGIKDALRTVFRNRNFRWFLGSFMLYWLSLTFIQLGIGFYTTLLFGLDKSTALTFSVISFASSFLLYLPINFLAKRMGIRKIMLLGYLVLGGIFLLTVFVKDLPFSKEWMLYGMGVAAAGPLAIFGILPNAIVGNEAEREEKRSGHLLTGMFFGLTAFTMKVGISVANLIFPSLLLFGRSTEHPTGVQLTAFAAFIFCLAGWWAFGKYKSE